MYSMQVDDTIYQSSVLDSCSLLAPLSCLRVRGPASVFRGELGISCVLLSPCSSHGKGQAGPCVLPACFSGGNADAVPTRTASARTVDDACAMPFWHASTDHPSLCVNTDQSSFRKRSHLRKRQPLSPLE